MQLALSYLMFAWFPLGVAWFAAVVIGVSRLLGTIVG